MDMKFKQYLKENNINEEIFKIINKIHSSCQPFLKEWFKSFSNESLLPLYRGAISKPDYYIGKIRKDRRPMNTTYNDHEELNDLFLEYYGKKWRSESIFVTGSFGNAEGYGDIYLIFPIGKFKFLYNPNIEDLFLYNGSFTTAVKGYESKNLKKAIKSGNEIMISGSSYIAVDYNKYSVSSEYNLILEWFNKYRNTKPSLEKLRNNYEI
jgi:hypothetical protein